MSVAQAVERSTDAMAVAAVASPIWLPYVQEVSELSALLLPIAGLVWLVIQMISHFRKR